MPELRIHLFTIGVAGQSGTAILLCSGAMVPGSIERLQAALVAAAATSVPVVEVDLRKVSHIGRESAAVLLQARQDLGRQGRELRLAVNSQAEALLRRQGAGSLLNPSPPAGVDLARFAPAAESQTEVGRPSPLEREE